jgi:hypothetical protein
MVEWFGDDSLLVRRKDTDSTERIPVAPAPENRQEHFIRWIRERSRSASTLLPTPEVTADGALQTLEVCLAFLESAADGHMKTLSQLAPSVRP